MQQTAIFGPLFAMIGLTFAVWVYLYAKRVPFILRTNPTNEQMVEPGGLARIAPPSVNNPSDNLKNLFEMPVLFYALVGYLFAAGRVDGAHVAAAWVFVLFRGLHSAVHCTVNVVIVRFWLYFASTLALAFMALRAALGHFAS